MDSFRATAKVLEALAQDGQADHAIQRIGNAIAKAHRHDGTVFSFGNGGSASQADHLTGELLGRFSRMMRPAVRSQCLSNEVSAMTAWANDEGYQHWPERIVSRMNERDVLIVLSTSCADHTGRGSNVVEAVREAHELVRPPTIAIITGSRFLDSPLAAFPPDVLRVIIPSDDVCTVQEATLVVLHEVCRRFEASFFG